MKTVLSFLLIMSLGVFYAIEHPQAVTDALTSSKVFAIKSWYEHEVRIEGNSLIPPRVISELLPPEKSNLWWHMNGELVSVALRTSPLIEDAQVSRCGWWSCFSVKVKERFPAFIAVVDDESKAWVVGRDGEFISPLSREQFRAGALDAFGPFGKNLVVVKGLWREGASADLLRARLLASGDVIRNVQAETGLPIRALTLVSNDELDIELAEVPFIVAMDLGVHGGPSLSEKARRLRQVLKELEGRYDQVKKVDFAFNKMAVVTLK